MPLSPYDQIVAIEALQLLSSPSSFVTNPYHVAELPSGESTYLYHPQASKWCLASAILMAVQKLKSKIPYTYSHVPITEKLGRLLKKKEKNFCNLDHPTAIWALNTLLSE